MYVEKDEKFVYFGSFMQDETQPTPIKWRVHSIDGDCVRLICDVVLFAMPFDQDCAIYEKSAVRQYLNGEFLEKAFNKEERAQIIDTDLGGFSDKVYLPALQDVERYARKDRIREVTKYAEERGASASEEIDEDAGINCARSGWYWTRTMAGSHVSDNHRFACNITCRGQAEHTCVWSEDIGVVPMITLKRTK